MKIELEILKEQVKKLEEMQRQCTHYWEEPQRDTMKKEIWETQWVGVDCFPVPTGRYETVPCWSHMCKKSGKKEYTEKMEEVAVQTVKRPKF